VLVGVFAHQGGWDEAIFLAAPLVVFGGLLWLAGRRARRDADQRAHSDD
jgi:hypothetical protein